LLQDLIAFILNLASFEPFPAAGSMNVGEQIFGCTLSSLPDLCEELTAEGVPLIVTESLLDRFFLSILSQWDQKRPILLWLCECFSRSISLDTQDIEEKQREILKKAQFLIFSYSGMLIQTPDLFPQSEPVLAKGHLLFCDLLAKTGNKFLSLSFVQGLVKRWQAEGKEELHDVILEPIFHGAHQWMQEQQLIMGSELSGCFKMLNLLFSFRELTVECMENSALWLPQSPLALGRCIFGPLLEIGLDAKGSSSPFAISNEKPVVPLEGAFYFARSFFTQFHSTLGELFLTVARIHKEALITFMVRVLTLNGDRVKMNYERERVSSDWLLLNLNAVMLRLCQPIIKAGAFEKIDPLFYTHTTHIHDVLTSTKFHLSEAEFKEIYDPSNSSGLSFSNLLFFLTSEFFRVAIVRMANNMMADIKEMMEIKNNSLPHFRNLLLQGPNDIFHRRRIEALIAQNNAKIDATLSMKLKMDVFFGNESFVQEIWSFLAFRMKWMLSLQRDQFITLPEYSLKDLIDLFSYFLRVADKTFVRVADMGLVFEFLVILLHRKDWIKNPHLKSSIIELLFLATDHEALGLESITSINPILMPSLMDFYVAAEYTGFSSQFYDKFNIRFYISRIFQYLWRKSSCHKARVKELASDEIFVRFVNYLIGDVGYLLGEALGKLAEIHTLQQELAATNSSLTPEEREEKSRNLASMERMCTGYMDLTVENLTLFSTVSSEIATPFMRAEIIDRLVAMLNFNLAELVGPKCSSLKVANPSKYNFNPRQLLGLLFDIYTHLARKEFAIAVAKDSRSYKRAIMEKHLSIIRASRLRSEPECEKYSRFIQATEKFFQTGLEKDKEMGEIPDEFLDPLMATLMEDPVILPTSNVTVDRSTIVTHLLNNEVDPFNRMPLKIEQVISNDELRQQIQEFKAKSK
jgi:ubiquitin conjugation factor E4 B